MDTRDLMCPVDLAFFFFFLVAALKMLLYLIFRVLLPWLPESFLSSTPIVAGRQ